MGDAQPAQQQGKNNMDFYIRLARPLIFNLPEAQDRVLASAWVRKIKDADMGREKLRTDYIKLLLFALQRKKLVGIFSEDPTGYEKLEEFPEEYDLNEMARQILLKEKKERIQRIRRQLRGQTGDYPPYSTDLSPDLREYVAAQDIPGFGVHCYYAISKDPVNTWLKADKGVFPKMAKSAVDTSGPTPPGTTLSDSCICKPGEDPKEPLGECKAIQLQQQPAPKKKMNKKLGKTPPTAPLGKMPEPDDRTPPLWGSNLLEVRDVDNSDLLPEVEAPADARDREEEEALMREMGFVVADYMSGEIITRGHRTKRKKKPPERDQEQEGGWEGEGGEEEEGGIEGEAEEEESADTAKRREEIMQDAKLLEYFKGKLEKAQHKQKMMKFSEKLGEAVPARSGIPVTTPKPSVLPQRIPNAEMLLSSGIPGAEALPPGEQLRLPEPKPLPPGKDEPMFRMYEKITGAIEVDEQIKMILDRAAKQQALLDMNGTDEDGMGMPADQVDAEPPPEPIKPIQRGSPQATGIIGMFMDSMNEQQPPPRPVGPPPPHQQEPKMNDEEGKGMKPKRKKDGKPQKATYEPSGSPATDQQIKNIMDRAAQQQSLLDQQKFGIRNTQFHISHILSDI
ncbi:unnamed protein product [Acanthoscelides obtectus]|uniref:DUF4485 domain-containing protein n=1 Tax=Acanthoscelides obtectus TaxID=200917 RepID=A0A9P0LV23_ACAOB|nr:unnamed protein product [Acanthoscelides obtectus]CAK1664153.1 hypothetical protein AOBTE_LOCUS24085 [Acanthoscelides obtectus]